MGISAPESAQVCTSQPVALSCIHSNLAGPMVALEHKRIVGTCAKVQYAVQSQESGGHRDLQIFCGCCTVQHGGMHGLSGYLTRHTSTHILGYFLAPLLPRPYRREMHLTICLWIEGSNSSNSYKLSQTVSVQCMTFCIDTDRHGCIHWPVDDH